MLKFFGPDSDKLRSDRSAPRGAKQTEQYRPEREAVNIANTGGVEGTPRVPEVKKNREAQRAYEQAPTAPPRDVDRTEISEEARNLQRVASAPAIREDRVAELKKLIESGEYETPDRIRGAVERLLADEEGI